MLCAHGGTWGRLDLHNPAIPGVRGAQDRCPIAIIPISRLRILRVGGYGQMELVRWPNVMLRGWCEIIDSEYGGTIQNALLIHKRLTVSADGALDVFRCLAPQASSQQQDQQRQQSGRGSSSIPQRIDACLRGQWTAWHVAEVTDDARGRERCFTSATDATHRRNWHTSPLSYRPGTTAAEHWRL